MTQHAIVLCAAVKPDLCLPANNIDSTSSTHMPQKYPRHQLARQCLQHTCLRNIRDIYWQDCVFNTHCLRNIQDIDWQDHVCNTRPQKYPTHGLARPCLKHPRPQKYPRHRLARPICLQHARLRNILDIYWQDQVSNMQPSEIS